MKLKTILKLPSRKILGAAMAAVLLITVVGCIHISVNVVSPQAQGGGGSRSSGIPDVSGGVFVPVRAPRSSSTTAPTVCGLQVSKYYVRFSNPYLWQTSPPTAIAFQGRVVNTNTEAIIPSANYLLQWFIDISNKGCATNITSTQIGFPVLPNTAYRFTAYFKQNVTLPPAGNQIELQGSWILGGP